MRSLRTHLGRIRRISIGAVVVALLSLAGCGSTSTGQVSPTATIAPTTTMTTTPTAAPTSTVAGYPLKVYFSKTPESENNLSEVFAVNRISTTPQVANFAVQLLIAGPTPEERALGYYSELNGLFNGTSQCPGIGPVGGPDFTLALNKKATSPEQGTATLKFCRVTLSPGEGVDARVLAELRTTLLQFAGIKKVAILNIQGNCFGDLSGLNQCLK